MTDNERHNLIIRVFNYVIFLLENGDYTQEEMLDTLYREVRVEEELKKIDRRKNK